MSTTHKGSNGAADDATTTATAAAPSSKGDGGTTTTLAAAKEQSLNPVAAKKPRMADDAANVEEKDFDKETQKALEEIDANQNEIDALNEQASEEILKVEQKYNKLRRPFFDKRNEIIRRVPKFWLTAFINHPQISAIIEEEEEDCLQYLNKLEVEEFEDIKSGYKIKLHFDDNPFFEDQVLTKEFNLVGGGGSSSDDPASTSTQIRWKEGFNLAAKAAQRAAAAAARSGRKRPLDNRTFFSWFCDNGDPSADDVAEVIKDDMWPNPLQYFLVPDIEVENGEDEEDLEEEEEDIDENVVVLEEEEEDLDGEDDDEDDLEEDIEESQD